MVSVRVCAAVVTGFHVLAPCLFNVRGLEIAAGSDDQGAPNSTCGSDENSIS